MKVFTLNGPKMANVAFAFLCMTIIVYVGFLNHHTVVVTATITPTVPIALVVDGFGTGQSGTREFLYMDIAFSGIVDNTAPWAAEDERLLNASGKEIFTDIMEIDFETIHIDGIGDISEIEENLRRAVEQAKNDGFGVIVARLGVNGGVHSANAINNIYREIDNIEFVTISDLRERIES